MTTNITMIETINTIVQNCTFIEEKQGHWSENKVRNPYKIYQQPGGNLIALVTCAGPLPFFLIDLEMWNKYKVKENGKPVTWSVNSLNYIQGYYTTEKNVRLHLLIKNRIGLGNQGLTVHHDDNCTINNLRSNLKLATKSEQAIYRHGSSGLPNTKKQLKKSAKVPEGLTFDMMPQCISYMSHMERFVIRSHDLQKSGKYPPYIYSSRSKKKTWQEKLAQIKEKKKELDEEWELENPEV